MADNFNYDNLFSKFQNLDKSNNPESKGKRPKVNKNNNRHNNDTTESETTTTDDIINDATNDASNDQSEPSNAAESKMSADDEPQHRSANDSTLVHGSMPIEKWLQNNKMYNSELLVVLKANHVDNEDDLKSFFEEGDDLAGVIKSVRKRTEKVLGNFSKKVVDITGIDYEYKPPRHRAKNPSNVSNASNQNSRNRNDSYLTAKKSNSPRNRPGSPRGRSYSNTSSGSQGQIGAYSYRKHRGRPTPTGKEVQIEANAHNSANLRQWLQRRNIFHKDLFSYLANHGYQTPDDLEVLTEKEFDKIVREVRVETFKEVSDSARRNRVDKLLVKFEVQWRKLSGLRKTNMTQEQQEQWGYSPRTASQRALEDTEEDNSFFS